jgi:hypothetical protein
MAVMSDVREFDSAIRNSARTREREIARIADRQHGVIAHHQLRALGFRPTAIHRRITAGRLHHLHVGVYAVGHSRTSAHGRWMAAVLACGPTAVLSHNDAAALWDLIRAHSGAIHVTTARRCHGRAGIVLHRSNLRPEDCTERESIPVTTPARTLLDLAETAPHSLLERAIEQAEVLKLFDLRAVDRLLARSHGRHGLGALTTALRAYWGPGPVTRSELERRFLELCRMAGLPPPAMNMFVAGMEVDALWHKERLVVELDGRAYHRTRMAFERDRRRDAALQLAGYRVLRLTHLRLTTEPPVVVETIRSLFR